MSSARSLPPVLYHYFQHPLPYTPALALQRQIHALQLARRREGKTAHPDVLLLLQHRPVFTGGRRQKEEEIEEERMKLSGLGAEWVGTDRGGQTTYHGIGQITAYPLMDLGRAGLTVRDYICRLQKVMERHIWEKHGIAKVESEHTGLFVSPLEKIGSIGVQVRHRLTTHGFAFNVTREPEAWFNRVVACGMADVKAVSVESVRARRGDRESISVEGEIGDLVGVFGRTMGREMVGVGEDREVRELIEGMEREAARMGDAPRAPSSFV